MGVGGEVGKLDKRYSVGRGLRQVQGRRLAPTVESCACSAFPRIWSNVLLGFVWDKFSLCVI